MRRAAAILAVLLPLALLADLHSSFYVDWYNNLWLVALHGRYLRWHHALPTVLSTDDLVGLPVPLFYGYLLYPALGAISSVTGAHLAIRLGCLGVVSLEFYAVAAAGYAVFRHRGLAYALAVTLVWSVYSLTDLYNRSAVPEFFATAFLTAAVGFVAATLGETGSARQAFHLWMAALCAALALGSHPPTTVVAAPLLGALGLVAAVGALRWEQGRSRAVVVGGIAVALAALAVAPWFDLNLHWARHLEVWVGPGRLMYIPERCDNLLSRFLPFPYDPLGTQKGIDVSTPYLEAPLAFGLWVMLVWLLWVICSRGRRPRLQDRTARLARIVLPCALLWAGFIITLSLWPPLSDLVPYLSPTMQFAYRLVSHCNIALMVAVLAAGLAVRGKLQGAQANVVAAICIAIAALNLGIKLIHADTVLGHIASVDPLLSHRPEVANVFREYATPGRLRELTPAESARATPANFTVARGGADYDLPQPLPVHLAQPGWVQTNALLFPFVHVLANGRRVVGDDLARQGERIAVRLPAGDTTLAWQWHPNPIWSALRDVGMLAMGALVLGAFWFGLAAVKSPPPRFDAPGE